MLGIVPPQHPPSAQPSTSVSAMTIYSRSMRFRSKQMLPLPQSPQRRGQRRDQRSPSDQRALCQGVRQLGILSARTGLRTQSCQMKLPNHCGLTNCKSTTSLLALGLQKQDTTHGCNGDAHRVVSPSTCCPLLPEFYSLQIYVYSSLLLWLLPPTPPQCLWTNLQQRPLLLAFLPPPRFPASSLALELLLALYGSRCHSRSP
mmetsp:Transcript_37300/g.76466  ORF Transcript_37300/g.76466 Transcript_37300/m.76466 type:complete len:202 (-) Transcript_37300:265-870(-)